MKNYLINWQTWQTDFNGDPITAQLFPLKRGEFLRVLPLLDEYWEKNKPEEGDDGSRSGLKNAVEMNRLLEQVEDILVGHVKDITGFEVNGCPPKVEDILSSAVFVPLLSEMLFALVDISKISGREAKNSEGQSTSAASAA